MFRFKKTVTMLSTIDAICKSRKFITKGSIEYYSHTVFLFYILQTILFQYAEILKNDSLRYPVESQISFFCFLIIFRREISRFRSHYPIEKERLGKTRTSLYFCKKPLSTKLLPVFMACRRIPFCKIYS